jgi:hypothetical protein
VPEPVHEPASAPVISEPESAPIPPVEPAVPAAESTTAQETPDVCTEQTSDAVDAALPVVTTAAPAEAEPTAAENLTSCDDDVVVVLSAPVESKKRSRSDSEDAVAADVVVHANAVEEAETATLAAVDAPQQGEPEEAPMKRHKPGSFVLGI